MPRRDGLSADTGCWYCRENSMISEIVKVSLAAGIWAILLYVLQRRIRTKQRRVLLVVVFVLKLSVWVGLSYVLIGFDSVITWRYPFVLGGLYVAVLADIIRDVLFLLFVLFRKKQVFQKLSVLSTVLCTGFTLLYCVINMQLIFPEHFTFTSEKLQSAHTFVFMADLHYGTAQNKESVKRAFQEIGSLAPEFIVLGGDMTDEFTTREEMEELYAQLGSLDTPVYFIYGNHDNQDHAVYAFGAAYTEEELIEVLENNGITILKDAYVPIADDLILLGRETSSHPEKRAAVADLPNWPEDAYLIGVDHSPYNPDEILALGADLQLSGHTHDGQFLPMHLGNVINGYYVRGPYRVGKTDLLVTPGIGGWAVPLRNESHCVYEVVTLLPQ